VIRLTVDSMDIMYFYALDKSMKFRKNMEIARRIKNKLFFDHKARLAKWKEKFEYRLSLNLETFVNKSFIQKKQLNLLPPYLGRQYRKLNIEILPKKKSIRPINFKKNATNTSTFHIRSSNNTISGYQSRRNFVFTALVIGSICAMGVVGWKMWPYKPSVPNIPPSVPPSNTDVIPPSVPPSNTDVIPPSVPNIPPSLPPSNTDVIPPFVPPMPDIPIAYWPFTYFGNGRKAYRDVPTLINEFPEEFHNHFVPGTRFFPTVPQLHSSLCYSIKYLRSLEDAKVHAQMVHSLKYFRGLLGANVSVEHKRTIFYQYHAEFAIHMRNFCDSHPMIPYEAIMGSWAKACGRVISQTPVELCPPDFKYELFIRSKVFFLAHEISRFNDVELAAVSMGTDSVVMARFPYFQPYVPNVPVPGHNLISSSLDMWYSSCEENVIIFSVVGSLIYLFYCGFPTFIRLLYKYCWVYFNAMDPWFFRFLYERYIDIGSAIVATDMVSSITSLEVNQYIFYSKLFILIIANTKLGKSLHLLLAYTQKNRTINGKSLHLLLAYTQRNRVYKSRVYIKKKKKKNKKI
jgi:hypothetical protein